MTEAQPSVTRHDFYPHNKAINRYHFSGVLTLMQALHIGSGRGDERTDALVVTNNSNKPVIPGSSLRGVFRAATERMLNGLDKGLWACELYQPEWPEQNICISNHSHQASEKRYRSFTDLVDKGDIDEVWKDLPESLCDACRLFGSGTFWASKIRFTDLTVLSPADPPRNIRHGVGIDRDTGTAAPGVKFDKEVVEAGAQFTFDAIAENLDDNDRQLLALGFSLLTGGDLALGGSSSRGLGGCKLENGIVEWVDFTAQAELVKYLTSRKYPLSKDMQSWSEQILLEWL